LAGKAENTVENLEAVSFEQAMKELEGIVRRLDGAAGDLETSIQDYLRGTALTQHCQKKLADARLRIEAIVKREDGVSLEPFETQD
jgi:exodeoxyribonuclease VII small subunit